VAQPGGIGASKYAGFISYSHHDRKVGEWLHRALERYRVPRRLVGQPGAHGPVPARLYPIFRDRDELSAGVLAEQLRAAIGQSRCFILICSPQAAASRWVNAEVEQWFAAGGSPARLLCLIADGEPNATAQGRPERECLPPALRNRIIDGLPFEPMAAQLDADADGRDNARLKLIAGMLGVGYDELKRRDLVARNRRLAMLAGLSLGVAAMTVALAIYAVLAQREAERSRQQGEDLIGFMLGALRGKLEPLGKLDILDAVGDQAIAYFAGLDTGRDPGPRALAARAKALRQIGEVRFAQGRPAEAVDTLTAALKIQRDLSRRQPDDNELLFELGQTEFWVGYAAWRAGQYDRAESNLIAYERVSQQLAAREPANPKYQTEVAYALNNLGVLAYERKRYAEALPLFQQSSSAAGKFVDDPTIDAETVRSLLDSMSWEGSTLVSLHRYDEGLLKLGEHSHRLHALVRQHPDDRRQQYQLLLSLTALGSEAINAGQPELALATVREGIPLGKRLIASDPSNVDYRLTAARHLHIEAAALFQQQRWQAAAASNAEAHDQLLEVLHHDHSRAWARHDMVRCWDLALELAWRNGDVARIRATVSEALKELGLIQPEAIGEQWTYANVHLFALERALYLDHDQAAAASHRTAASAALQLIKPDTPDDSPAIARLRALLGLMSGADHIPDTAQPDNASPYAYSVARFMARRCAARPPELAAAACRELENLPQPRLADPINKSGALAWQDPPAPSPSR